MHEFEIFTVIIKTGIKFTDIDNKYDLPRGTSRLAVSMPNKKGEEALSKVFMKPLNYLFPKRYNEKNERLKPQPTHKYYVPIRDGIPDYDLSEFRKEDLVRIRTEFFKDNKNDLVTKY